MSPYIYMYMRGTLEELVLEHLVHSTEPSQLLVHRKRPGSSSSSSSLRPKKPKLNGWWRCVCGLERKCSGRQEAWRHQGNTLPLRYVRFMGVCLCSVGDLFDLDRLPFLLQSVLHECSVCCVLAISYGASFLPFALTRFRIFRYPSAEVCAMQGVMFAK